MGGWWEYLIAALGALALFFLNDYTKREAAKEVQRKEEKKKAEDELLQIEKSKKLNAQIADQKKKAETLPWK